MPRTRRRRANWPYRLAWLGLVLAALGYVGLRTLTHAAMLGHRSAGIDWQLALVASLFDATIAGFFFVVGACIGSFLNVVAYRVPLGRYIGGHSGCPYCQTPIEGIDNVPILAWIKLRGRCRTCRLPISAQYPLVELAVAVLFLSVYLSEFASGGANLPGANQLVHRGGILRVNVTLVMVVQLASYLFLLSSLVAAALIAVKQRYLPLRLYAWGIAPLAIAAVAVPQTVVVPWRTPVPTSAVEARLDAIVSLICGAVAGVVVARLVAPILYRGFDRSLLSGDPATRGARQFVGALAVAGASVGWQATVGLAWCIAVCGIIAASCLAWSLGRYLPAAIRGLNLVDLTVWVWLGLAVFRAWWAPLNALQLLPAAWPEVVRQLFAALLLAGLLWLWNRSSCQSRRD